MTDDGRYLLVAGGTGATVLSAARAAEGSSGAVLGTLSEPGNRRGVGAIEVIASPDGRYAFVSIEGAGQVAVYNLQRAISTRFRNPGFVGTIRPGEDVVGTAISPSGRWLYVTSELAAGANSRLGGTLSVIDLTKAEHDPAKAVRTSVLAHCAPVRVAVSPNGNTVWVAARDSDQLLAFSASELLSDPARALIAAVRVGEAPVGLALVDNGQLIVVADSNRFNARGRHSALTVLSTAAILAHRPAILGTLRAGLFPREMALEPNGQALLVNNFDSGNVEVVSLPKLNP